MRVDPRGHSLDVETQQDVLSVVELIFQSLDLGGPKEQLGGKLLIDIKSISDP